MNFGILRLYCGSSGTKGFYNMQELGLAKSLAKKNYNVYIFILDKNIKKTIQEDFSDNIHLVSLPCKSINNHGFFKLDYLKKFNINILQIGSDNQIYAPSVINYCKKNNIKFYNYIGTIESDSNNKFKRNLIDFLCKRNLKKYKQCINFAKTPYVYEQLKKSGVENVDLLSVGLDLDNINIKLSNKEIFDKYNLDNTKKYIMFVGRLENYKSPLILPSLIREVNEEFNFIIVGSGSLKTKLFELLEKDNLLSRIKYIEKISNSEIHELYSISDYFINFNRVEIFGMSILEAMYNGCTVVAFHAPGPDYILRNNMGYLVNNEKEMGKIINSNECYERGILKDYIIKKFSWDNFVEKISSKKVIK